MTGAPLLADFGIAPVVIFWVVMMLAARAKKQKQREQASRLTPMAPPMSQDQRTGPLAPSAEGGLLGELRKAMEELKRAEQQTAAPGTAPGVINLQARARLEQKKQEAARRRAAKQVAQRLPMGAADDQSSEGASLENSDYDNEAEQIIAARRQAAERRVREDISVEDLTDQQKARRASRSAIAIGGEAEHNAWHSEIGGKGEAVVKKRASPFHRFADGSPKSALVMSLILGPPPGLSQDD